LTTRKKFEAAISKYEEVAGVFSEEVKSFG
jgi:hypothetical protein